MSGTVAIHTIELLSGIESKDFEEFMTEEAFPITAEVPGSIDRGGRSAIESQHLLKDDADGGRFWWLIKHSGFLSSDFNDIVDRMYELIREKLETFGILESSASYVVIDSLSIGPRDSLGRPTGSPERGSDL